MYSSLADQFPEGGLSLVLRWLPLSAWRVLGCSCQRDLSFALSAHKDVARRALEVGVSLQRLAATSEAQVVALRIWWIAGIDIECLSTPRVASDVFTWAHYGTARGKGKGDGKGKANWVQPRLLRNRTEHLACLATEFPDIGEQVSGIQATMRRELRVVETALTAKLAMNGSTADVDLLPMVPMDTPGKLKGQLLVERKSERGKSEATLLMWATRHGVRWVKLALQLGSDPGQVAPSGWTALLYAAAFESRGVVLDGASDSGEAYGGMSSRALGVVGPVLKAGAGQVPTLPVKEFLRLFEPSPVCSEMIGPAEIASCEGGAYQGWAAELRKQTLATQ